MQIKTDERLNEQLQEEASTLRRLIIDNNKTYSTRFVTTESKDSPSMFITDTETDKTIEVPLYAFGDVMKVLRELFED